MSKIKENWLVLVLAMVLTIVGNILVYSFTSTDSAIKAAVPREYVDKKDDALQNQIDKKVNKDELDRTLSDIKESMKKRDSDISYSRDKIDDIYRILLEDRKRR